MGPTSRNQAGKGRAGTAGAAVKLDEAAELALELKHKLEEALDENGKVRWLDRPADPPAVSEPDDEERSGLR
ncbi:hypothetical protein GCM10027404_33200 [Arthrobacter tumbae]|uniref:hypothetical protein n=1 Tax=Arthrobacter tumbae TaxID=163874 RepID=UPI00195E65B0|nr:hypothetical protein [Arthrobacter tumbae]MBM7781799.1 hypothetical protein [Arthrobacter tumbae]